ncbi:MAG: phosphotransferase [Pseudomonadota bacterium]|nr:phosphotransferase [Pseudomonadota bacterium]
MTTLVTTPAEMTVEWFNAVLGRTQVLDGARIVAVTLDRIGHGMIARMVRAVLEYDRETTAPASVVVKFPTDDPGSLQVARAMGLYEQETRFYRDVAPLLAGMSIPACHLAEIDEDTGGFTLVLEDLSGRTRPGDVLTPCTLAECASGLSELVRFQSPLWNSPVVAKLAWLADRRRTHQVFDALPAGLGSFVERFGRGLAPEHVKLFETVLPRAGEWVRSWSEPSVVQHGDFRSDNLMFAAAPGVPTVTVIDFQTVRLGPPGVDPAYFLASCLSTADRRKAERDLIAEYHRGLLANGVGGFDFDACWKAYRAGAMYGVFLFVGMAGQVESTERGDRLIVEQIRRFADMALDLDAPTAAGLS